jgi:hypothetical protein
MWKLKQTDTQKTNVEIQANRHTKKQMWKEVAVLLAQQNSNEENRKTEKRKLELQK